MVPLSDRAIRWGFGVLAFYGIAGPQRYAILIQFSTNTLAVMTYTNDFTSKPKPTGDDYLNAPLPDLINRLNKISNESEGTVMMSVIAIRSAISATEVQQKLVEATHKLVRATWVLVGITIILSIANMLR